MKQIKVFILLLVVTFFVGCLQPKPPIPPIPPKLELLINQGDVVTTTISQPVSLTTMIVNGKAPYNYVWTLSGIGFIDPILFGATIFLSRDTGTAVASVTVTDAMGTKSTDSITITVKPSKDYLRVKCRIRPIIIHQGNVEEMVEASKITESFVGVNEIFEPIGISFIVLPAVYELNNRLYDVSDSNEWIDVTRIQQQIYDDDKELAFFVVGKLSHWNNAAGVANYPSNSTNYRFGIAYMNEAIKMDRTRTQLLSHELGHYLNVKHPWEDDIEDTYQTDMRQGCNIQPCLVMNYCWNHPLEGSCLVEDKFTPMQFKEAQHWVLSPPRIDAMYDIEISSSILKAKRVYTYTDRTQPEVDPIEK